MKKTTSICLTAIVCLLGLLWADSCFAKGNEFVVANHTNNYDSLFIQPEVFLVKVTEVSNKYDYCKGMIDGTICYIEPLHTDTCQLNSNYVPIQAGKYYLMALVYSNYQIQLYYPILNPLDISVDKGDGELVSLYEMLRMYPDTYIAINMNGLNIRPIGPDDLVKHEYWPDFAFNPDIPAFIRPDEKNETYKKNVKDLQYGVNVLSKVNRGDYYYYFNKRRTASKRIKEQETQRDNDSIEIPAWQPSGDIKRRMHKLLNKNQY